MKLQKTTTVRIVTIILVLPGYIFDMAFGAALMLPNGLEMSSNSDMAATWEYLMNYNLFTGLYFVATMLLMAIPAIATYAIILFGFLGAWLWVASGSLYIMWGLITDGELKWKTIFND
jgi:hypothetical protein